MTRYAIRRTDDGRYLALTYQDAVRPIWVPEPDRAWTWPTMTQATLTALGELSLPAIGSWTVEAVAP